MGSAPRWISARDSHLIKYRKLHFINTGSGGLWHLEERIAPPENSLQQNDAVQLSPFYDLRNDWFYSTLNKTCYSSWRFISKGDFAIAGEGGEEGDEG